MNNPVLKYNALENLQVEERIAANMVARKALFVKSVVNAGKIMATFIIQQKNKEGKFIVNKSTQDLKQALTWYNDLIRATNDK